MLAFDAYGEPTGPRVVLVHGWPLRRDIWAEVAPLVASAGFYVLAPDLPGFGESPPMGFERASVEAYADDLAAFLEPFGDRVALAGHSFGGYVALALAERRPELLCGLALISSRTIADSEVARAGRHETIAKVRAEGTEALLPSLADKLLGPKASARMRDRAAALVSTSRPDGVIAGLAAMASRPDRTAVLERFPASVLIVHGSADALIPVREAAQPARTSGSLRLILLPGVGHMPMWEAPQATSDAIVHWAKASHAERP